MSQMLAWMYSWEKERSVKDQAELAVLQATLPFTG